MTKQKYFTLEEIFRSIDDFKGDHATINCAMRFLSTRNQENTLFLKLRKDYDENAQTRKQFNSVMRVAKTVGKKVEIVWK
ncbi:MAG: hypothetical protein WAV68_00895 [Candidatus Nanogingivalis sp.]|jgi:hypothetical protein